MGKKLIKNVRRGNSYLHSQSLLLSAVAKVVVVLVVGLWVVSVG